MKSINLRFVLRGFAITVLIVLLALPVLLGAGFMVGLTAPICGGSTVPPFPHEDVTFTSAEFDRPTRAYFIPADDARGTVIALPTGSQGRGDRMGEIAVYHGAGYHVLTYESRMCVGGAVNTLGYREADQVGDALAYLRTRSDVDMGRVALHGFSAGGASALFAAARHPDVRAGIAQGNYADFGAEIDRSAPQIGVLGGLFRFGALSAYRITTGLNVSVLRPIDAIPQIAPRPVLLIYGTREPGLAGARHMAALGDHVTLWEVAGAVHGNYIDIAGDEYARRIDAFLSQTLVEAAEWTF